MNCPNCGLINPTTAGRCDCGYDFQVQKVMASYLSANVPVRRMRKRHLAMIMAFCVGWLVGALALIVTAFDGFIFLIFLAFTSAIISLLFLSFALLAGLVLRVPVLSKFWNKTPMWSLIVASVSSIVLMFGLFLVVVGETGKVPEPDGNILRYYPFAAVASYFLLLFAVSHWPTERKVQAS